MSDLVTNILAASQLKKGGLCGNDVKIAFFNRIGNLDEYLFKCKECERVYKSKSGNSNLINHAASHADWIDKIVNAKSIGGPLDHYIHRRVSPKAINLFRWIELCVMNDEPFEFVENEYVRKNSRNESISRKTLVKYMELVHRKVELKLKAVLNAVNPKRFGLVFDSWTCTSDHYTAIFITWTDKMGSVQMLNLSCGVQQESEDDELAFDAEAMGDYFVDELQNVGLNLFEHIDFVTGDNCAVNKRFATLISNRILRENGSAKSWCVPLVGCASHRLNLARMAFYGNPGNEIVIQKIDMLMTKLRTLKNSAKLRKVTNYCPENNNATRWTSTSAALEKFKKIEPHLPTARFGEDVLQFIPTALESNQISSIIASDQSFASASRALQRGGNNHLEMVHVRALFDKLIMQHPESAEKLSPTAEIIHSPAFETAVCKVQSLDERSLNVNEKKAVRRFLIEDDDTVENSDEDEPNEDSVTDWAQDAIDDTEARKRQRMFLSKYRSMKHVSPTSNVCERIFSRAKLIMRPHRKHMSPFHLEMLIFLRCNKVLWDETTVENCTSESGEPDDDIA